VGEVPLFSATQRLPLLPHSDGTTFLKLAFWVCETNPSTLEETKRAQAHQIGVPKQTETKEKQRFHTRLSMRTDS